jgi:hypothetical protein
MGWTNSVLIFHDNITFILQAEIPHVTIPYINDMPFKGPMTMYQKVDNSYYPRTQAYVSLFGSTLKTLIGLFRE